jgi:hypothetical protein
MTNRREVDFEPLRGDENAQHREMWRDFERRRWFRERADIWFKTFIAIPTAILSLYGVWQMWRGGK